MTTTELGKFVLERGGEFTIQTLKNARSRNLQEMTTADFRQFDKVAERKVRICDSFERVLDTSSSSLFQSGIPIGDDPGKIGASGAPGSVNWLATTVNRDCASI